MDTSIAYTSHELTVKHAGLAVECGTLAVLLDAVIQQPVMVMPLARTIQRGSLTIHQWILHITTRCNTDSPVYYATLRAAEAIQRPTSTVLAFPYPQREDVMHHAHRLQEELSGCIVHLLSQHARVSHLVMPARFCLPDEWIWPARCQEPRILCRDGAWVLVDA